MRGLVLTIALAAAGVTAQSVDVAAATAAPGDPLRSAECREALASLQRDEEAAAARAASGPAGDAHRADASRQRPIPANLQASRRKTADACLQGRDDPASASAAPPERSRVRPPPAQAPIAIPRSSPERPALPGAVRREPPAPVTRPTERPRFITTCDAIGCWADDGSRLDRVGPDLRGPRGLCTVQGTLLTCP